MNEWLPAGTCFCDRPGGHYAQDCFVWPDEEPKRNLGHDCDPEDSLCRWPEPCPPRRTPSAGGVGTERDLANETEETFLCIGQCAEWVPKVDGRGRCPSCAKAGGQAAEDSSMSESEPGDKA